MATAPHTRKRVVEYPTSDGRPMAETDWHRELMFLVIDMLKAFYSANPMVYVSGNLLLFYEEGNKRKHLSPDVFVVKGIPMRQRPYYLLWEEGKGPDMVIELTSKTTRKEDLEQKYALYRDRLQVKEYFLFDPLADYLPEQLMGYRLRKGDYHPIKPVNGRLPSRVLGLDLEACGRDLRFFDAETGAWLPTVYESMKKAEEARQQEAAARQQEAAARQQAEAEVDRLQQELRDLRRRLEGRN